MRSKGLLSPGQSLYEVDVEKVEGSALSHRAFINANTPLEAIASEAGRLPTVVADDLLPEEVKDFASQHLYAALQAGYDPNDECLHWFHPDFIEEFLPSTYELLELEAGLIQRAGELLVSKGRMPAVRYLTKVLGLPSAIERKDWNALPMAYVRDFLETSTEDSRSLMIARVELLARKAEDELDLKTQMAAAKLISQIQGLLFNDLDAKSQRMLALLFAQGSARSMDQALPSSNTPTSKKLREIADRAS